MSVQRSVFFFFSNSKQLAGKHPTTGWCQVIPTFSSCQLFLGKTTVSHLIEGGIGFSFYKLDKSRAKPKMTNTRPPCAEKYAIGMSCCFCKARCKELEAASSSREEEPKVFGIVCFGLVGACKTRKQNTLFPVCLWVKLTALGP